MEFIRKLWRNHLEMLLWVKHHTTIPSERAPQESCILQDLRTFTPHNLPVLHAPSGREVCSGPSMSVPGSQPSLYEVFPICKLSQQEPYPDSHTWGEAVAPYYFKAHVRSEPKHQEVPIIRLDSGHPLGHISPIRHGVLTQHTQGRRGMARLTI